MYYSGHFRTNEGQQFSLWFTAPIDATIAQLKHEARRTYTIIYDRPFKDMTVTGVTTIAPREDWWVQWEYTPGDSRLNQHTMKRRVTAAQIYGHGPCGTDDLRGLKERAENENKSFGELFSTEHNPHVSVVSHDAAALDAFLESRK